MFIRTVLWTLQVERLSTPLVHPSDKTALLYMYAFSTTDFVLFLLLKNATITQLHQ